MKLTVDRVAPIIGMPREAWAKNCHTISLAIVRAGIVPGGRVARGWRRGIASQHSWIAVDDCYTRGSRVIDPTLWTWLPVPDAAQDIWCGQLGVGAGADYHPHGAGSIFEYGRPCRSGGPIIKLRGASELSQEARNFLRQLGPLDYRGWGVLARAPVGGWPAAEILAAIDATPRLSALVPIDVLGMITDLNPGGLYR